MHAVMGGVTPRRFASRRAAHGSRLATLPVATIDTGVAANAELPAAFVVRRETRDCVTIAGHTFFPFWIGAHIASLAAGPSANQFCWATSIAHALLVGTAAHSSAVDFTAGIERWAACVTAHMARPAATVPIATLPIATGRLLAASAKHARIATNAVLAHFMSFTALVTADRPMAVIATQTDGAVSAHLPRRATPVRPMFLVPNNRAELAGVLRAAKANPLAGALEAALATQAAAGIARIRFATKIVCRIGANRAFWAAERSTTYPA